MSIIGNLSVLLTARVDGYRTDLGIARVETGRYKEVLENTGLSGKQFNQIMGEMRKSVFSQLSLQQQLAEEQRAVNYLFERGAISSAELDLALNALNGKYRELTESSKEFRDAERERQAVVSQIANLEASARTPQQKFDDRIGEIERLKQSGLSLQAANNEVFKAFQDFQRESGEFDRKQGLQKELEAVERLQQQRQSQIEALNRAAVKPEVEFNQRIAEIRQLQKEGLSVQAANAEFVQAYQRLQRRSGETERAARETQAMNEFNESARRGLNIVRPLTQQLSVHSDRLRDLGNAYKDGAISREDYVKFGRIELDEARAIRTGVISNAEAERQAANVKQLLGGRQQVLAGRLAQYRVLLDRGKLSQDEFNRSVRLARAEILGKENAIGRLLRPLNVLRTVGIGLAGARIFGGLFDLADEPFQFETQITKSIAVFKNSGNALQADFRDLRIAALEAGQDINNAFNSVDAAVALEKLARDGVQARLAIDSLPTVMSFATAAQTDFAGAVDLVSEVTKVMVGDLDDANDRLRQTTYIMDLLAKGSTLSSSDVTDLSEALLKASPQARELGLSARDTTAAVLALSEVGRKGFVGGNEFRIAFRDLARAFNENEDQFRRFGIQVFDSEGKFRGVANVIEEMTEALDKLTPQSRGELLKIFGLQDKGAQFQLQLAGLADTVRKFEEELNNVDGFAGALAADSLTETAKLIKNIRGEVVEFLNLNLVDELERIAFYINSIDTETAKSIISLGVFTGSFVVFVTYGPAIVATIKNIITGVRSLAVASSVLVILTTGFDGLRRVVVAAGAALAVTALFEGIRLLVDDTNEVGDAAGEAKDKIDELQEALGNVGNEANNVREKFASFAEGIASRFAEPYDVLLENLQGLRDASEFLDKDLSATARVRFIQEYVAAAQEAQKETEEIGFLITRLKADLERADQARAAGNDGQAGLLRIDAINRYRDALEQLEADKPLQDFAAQLEQSTRKPIEVLLDDLQEIQRASRFLDETTKLRAITGAVDQYAQSLEKVQEARKLNAAADAFGSAAEFSQVFTVKSDNSENSPEVKQLRELEAMRTNLDQLIAYVRQRDQRQQRNATQVPTQ